MILFLTPYPFDTAASQRFRFEQYYSYLQKKGIAYEIQPFWEENAWAILYQKGHVFLKVYYLIKGLVKRFLLLFKASKYKYVFVHRELFPSGPKFLIYLFAKSFKNKIIYDFDDAIWLENFAANNKNFAFLKSYTQVKTLCKYAFKVSVGNEYLKDYALRYNQNISINPTTIDTENLHNRINENNHLNVVIGWTGTHSTLKYVLDLLPILDELIKKYEFKLLIISDKKPDFERSYMNFKKWNKDSEIDDLLDFSLGIMPLTDDKWSRGKCGFKALQYMSLGIPALVSPVGVNSQIVDHLENGWICHNWQDWRTYLAEALKSQTHLKEMGLKARQKIISNYSVLSNRENFLSLFE